MHSISYQKYHNTNEYYDIFDMFICMSQQVQALFYKYDNLDREDTNNLWMREIVFENSKRFKIDKSFYLNTINNHTYKSKIYI